MTARSAEPRLDFESLFRSTPAAYLIVMPDAPDYHIVDVNAAYLAATMKQREDLIGRPLFAAFPLNPDDPTATGGPNIRHSLGTVLRTGQPHTIAAQRYDIAGPAGKFERRYWKLVSSPILDADGHIVHILHHVEDVTPYEILASERTRAVSEREQHARLEVAAVGRAEEAERRLQRVYQEVPLAMTLLSGPDHISEFANTRFRELVGQRPIIGRPIREALPELAGQGIFESLDGVYTTGLPAHAFGHPVRLDRGSATPDERFFNLVYQPLLDENGTTDSIALVAIDVTEVVRSREEAGIAARDRDAERRRLLAVLDQTPLGILVADAPSGRLLFSNARADQILGPSRPADDLHLYAASRRFFHRSERPIEPDEWPLARAVARGETVESEVLWLERAHGQRIEIVIKAAPVRDARGAIIAGIAVFWDVTAERRTERQLREAQRLQAVGTLAGGVAHEVNNQMTAVLGFGEFVLDALGPDHPQTPDQRQVLHAAERAARVTQQLLAFSRQQVHQPRVLDLRDLADGLQPVLVQLLGSDKELAIDASRARQRVSVDPSQVEQVLINLVANARDATPTGGRVTISVEDILVSGASTTVERQSASMAPGEYVMLTVTDTGAGMTPDTIARIFEPFFTTKPVGQGTGLGLAMVYGIVKQHGGYIWAHSNPGEGTAVRLYWPAVASKSSSERGRAGSDDHGTTAPSNAATILVVEDEDAVRQLTVRTLESAGFTVIAAEDGEAALGVIRGGKVLDLLLTDVIMPRVSGRQVADVATEIQPRLPVLFISGYAGDDMMMRELVPKDAPFLQKPFTPDELVRTVGDLLVTGERERTS